MQVQDFLAQSPSCRSPLSPHSEPEPEQSSRQARRRFGKLLRRFGGFSVAKRLRRRCLERYIVVSGLDFDA